MKREHRLRALGNLYVQLRSDDFDHREHALFQLALLLRRSHSDAGKQVQPDYVNDNLPRDLLRLRLSPDEKRGAVEQLTQVIITRPESRATAIWALGELEAKFALESALPAGDLAELRALLSGWAGTADARLAKRAEDLLAQLPPP